jgi:hypothetical protein
MSCMFDNDVMVVSRGLHDSLVFLHCGLVHALLRLVMRLVMRVVMTGPVAGRDPSQEAAAYPRKH